jgi:ATP/maltotriose-dependent transcriptional regulator MalT
MRYRIALVLAPAGWGKTVAVRAALADVTHRWTDPAVGDEAFAPSIDSDAELIVLDGVHVLDAPARTALYDAIRTQLKTRWVLISRERGDLPVAGWIASGDAAAPVVLPDLALSQDEIEAAALAAGVRTGDTLVRFLLEQTGGWPVAVRFALSTLERSADSARAIATTRRLSFDYLAAEVFDPLPDERRDFLYALAMAGTADESLLFALGRIAAASDAAWLRASAVPSIETLDGFSLHPTFAQFLLAQLTPAHAEALATSAASALRARGRIAEAFDAIRRFVPGAVLEELRTSGFALLDLGRWDEVDAAVRALPQSVRRDDPVVVCLRAQLEAQTGAVSRANDLYERAFQIAKTPLARATVSRHRAVHFLNQGDTGAVATIEPALHEGSDVDRVDARGIRAMALSLSGAFEEARADIRIAIDASKTIDDDFLVARSLYRASYVEFQAGSFAAARRFAGDAAYLAQRIGAWYHFICAHSVLYGAASSTDDPSAALWHAQQIGAAAERTGDRRHRLYALSAQYTFEVERGRIDRAAAIESEMPMHSSGFRDELELYVALAVRKSWSGAFDEAYRQLASLDERIVDPSERRLWNAALAMFGAFAADERGATAHLRACGKSTAGLARENAVGNALAECFAGIAQTLLGHPEAAVRRLPARPPSTQTRALGTFVRELAELGDSLGSDSARPALDRLRAASQEGIALAVTVALAARRDDAPALQLTSAERRVLAQVALGVQAEAIAQQLGRSIHTVRNQIKAATRKLGASGSIEAVARAKRLGLID